MMMLMKKYDKDVLQGQNSQECHADDIKKIVLFFVDDDKLNVSRMGNLFCILFSFITFSNEFTQYCMDYQIYLI